MAIKLSGAQATLVMEAAERAVSKQRGDGLVVGVGRLEAEEMVEAILKIVLPDVVFSTMPDAPPVRPAASKARCGVPGCVLQADFVQHREPRCSRHRL